MKVVVTGSQGQLGAELCRQLATDAMPPATHHPPPAPRPPPPVPRPPPPAPNGLDLPEFDLTDRDRVLETLSGLRPEVIINTAAFTLVDKAEQEAALCRRVNVEGVRHLVEACRRLDCTLVQISTDYVFGRDTARTRPTASPTSPAPRASTARRSSNPSASPPSGPST